MQERTALEDQLGAIGRIEQELDDQLTMIELGEAEKDQKAITDAEEALKKLKAEVARRELEALLSGEADANDSYLEVHAGAGGTESQDWANMLLRMYTRWAEQHGYKVEYLEETPGEEAGIKSATIEIKGRNAFGWLKTENGVHRLVRISPFDSNARRHTSFASVNVYPVIDDRIIVDIKEADVRIDTMRASGAGGQHVNKTESAIRLTHIPTNIVVFCQNDRSQHRNRAQAWQMLRARLYELELKKREAQAAAEQAAKTDIGWGHQIRSYVLQPYQMVKDLRTGVSTSSDRSRARRRSRSVHGGRAGAEGLRHRPDRGGGRGVRTPSTAFADATCAIRVNALRCAVELLSRAQEFLRVDRLAAHPRLVVQVRSGRAPGRTDLADDLPGPDRLADAHVDRREVTVAGGQAVAVVDVDHPAVAAAPARGRHLAVGGGAHRYRRSRRADRARYASRASS